jgi:hypothetical protein
MITVIKSGYVRQGYFVDTLCYAEGIIRVIAILYINYKTFLYVTIT